MNKQMPTVEWLNDKIIGLDVEFDMTLISRETYWVRRKEILEQANKMFEQQIIDAYDKGFSFGVAMLKEKQEEYISGEKYYNQNFNK